MEKDDGKPDNSERVRVFVSWRPGPRTRGALYGAIIGAIIALADLCTGRPEGQPRVSQLETVAGEAGVEQPDAGELFAPLDVDAGHDAGHRPLAGFVGEQDDVTGL